MERKVFLEAMEDILNVAEGGLTGGERLADFQSWDSLAALGVVAMARENAGVALRPEQLKGVVDLESLYCLLGGSAG